MKIVSMSKNYFLYAKSAKAFSGYEICTGELDMPRALAGVKTLNKQKNGTEM